MLNSTRLKSFYLTHLSKPASDRSVYRLLDKHKPRHVLEFGVGNGVRTGRMIELALHHGPAESMRYTGIDLFESRPAGAAGLKLKEAHRLLKSTGVRVQLIPGAPGEALARAANVLQGVDFVLISADQDATSLTQAWFYLPRTLSPRALILHETVSAKGETEFVAISLSDVQSRARQHSRRRAA